MSGPYAQGAMAYVLEGWEGILPLPPGAKYPPPDGFTGREGEWPSEEQIEEWVIYRGESNVCLRLPENVLGLDVDAYGTKLGRQTYMSAVERWGPLEPTWRSTSRDDGISGIYLFRVPKGLAWPNTLGPDVETIRHGHRYAVVHPSVHPEGRTYRWITPGGLTAFPGGMPCVDDLPELAPTWVVGMTGGKAAAELHRSALTPELAGALLDPAPMCDVMRGALVSAAAELRTAGSRHDTATRITMYLVRLRSEAHTGLKSALDVLWSLWLAAVTAPGTGARSAALADAEWRSMILGAAQLASLPSGDDPCSAWMRDVMGGWQGWTSPPATPRALDSASAGSLSPGHHEQDAGGDASEEITAITARAQRVLFIAEEMRMRAEAKAILARELRAPWRAPTPRSLPELLALPREPAAYAVEDVMPVGSNVLLTAQYKSGKTTMINHLAACLADGHPFLGRHKINHRGRIALWNYEVNETMYADWLSGLGIVNSDAVQILSLRGYPMPLIEADVKDWAIESLKGIHTWFLDPFAAAFLGNGESSNDNDDVGRFLLMLDEIKSEAGVSELILSTHTGRASMDVGTERARGATRLDDWCDVRWLLTTQQDESGGTERYFRATGRDVETEEGRITMDPISRALTLGEGQRERNAPQGRRNPPVRNYANEALEYLADHPRSSQRTLEGALGGRAEKLREALRALMSQDIITMTPGARNAILYSLKDREK